MHQGVASLRRLPATVIAFPVVVLVIDGTTLALDSTYVRERPLWTAFWALLALGLLGALVIWRQPWAWWLCVLNPIASLASPAWGARLHPISDIVALVFLLLLLTPSMRRHARILRARHESMSAPHWSPSARPLCLGAGGAFTLVFELEARHHTAHSVGGRIFAGLLIGLIFAAALRVLIRAVQGADRLAGRYYVGRPTPGP
jgi:hypothetical protein